MITFTLRLFWCSFPLFAFLVSMTYCDLLDFLNREIFYFSLHRLFFWHYYSPQIIATYVRNKKKYILQIVMVFCLEIFLKWFFRVCAHICDLAFLKHSSSSLFCLFLFLLKVSFSKGIQVSKGIFLQNGLLWWKKLFENTSLHLCD